MTIINFKEHKFRKEGKYKCECGNRFKRIATNCWTENPFNTTWVNEGSVACNRKCIEKMIESLSVKNCPKCNMECKLLKKGGEINR